MQYFPQVILKFIGKPLKIIILKFFYVFKIFSNFFKIFPEFMPDKRTYYPKLIKDLGEKFDIERRNFKGPAKKS